MMIGIEAINLYVGRCYLDLADLALVRGQDPTYVTQQLMCVQRSVLPIYEDAVTLAVNAVQRLATSVDLSDVELLVVATESAVDFGKPIATWVHRFCNLPAQCRNLEVKHACYGCTGAFKLAASWIASSVRPGKKALVINTDFSRAHLGASYEVVGGACAVAMLVSDNPQVLKLELEQTGYWTHEIADTFRPTAKAEVINDQISLYSYLDALEGAYEAFAAIAQTNDYDKEFRKHIYHAPFPGMPLQAHRALLNLLGQFDDAAIQTSFQTTVAESLTFAKRIGSAYGGSNFVCLLGLLSTAGNLQAGDRLSLFAYGSGCQGEFYSARIGNDAVNFVRSQAIEQHLNARLQLSVAEYEAIEKSREALIDCSDYNFSQADTNSIYAKCYAGQNLLVLQQLENYHRRYTWS